MKQSSKIIVKQEFLNEESISPSSRRSRRHTSKPPSSGRNSQNSMRNRVNEDEKMALLLPPMIGK